MKSKLTIAAILFASATLTAQGDEPLWLRNPAISPDGKTIAFNYQGDIYTVPYQGGEAKRITIHEAFETMPIWSPDSKQLAFASRRHGNLDVFMGNAEGGSPVRLTFHSADDEPYTFSPDGKFIYFGSSRLDHPKAMLFPTGALPELYKVSVSGGREMQVLTVPAEMAKLSPDGLRMLFHDRKGYEDDLRKHHTSSVARDVWMYTFVDSSFAQLTSHPAEDRNPIWAAGENRFFFLSERSGSFNVWKAEISGNRETNARQVSSFDKHPLRTLSLSDEGVLCYSYNGELYTQLDGQQPRKVIVKMNNDRRYNETTVKSISSGATDFVLSPNGKEIAFIVRGEVFVTAVDYPAAKQITNTPEQERNPHFNSDGTKLLYSSERNGSWNIYEASLSRKDEKYFYNATITDEKAIVETPAETFQARYSPDDKEVAFLEERTTLKVKNIASGEVRTVLQGSYNYSYSDGDQYYTWSPDSKWLMVQFIDQNRWNPQVGLVNATGKEAPVNLTKSGYGNSVPKFGMGGEMIYWESDRDGYRSHGSWGSQGDIYALFLTIDAWQRFKLNEADYAIWKEAEEERKKEADEKKDEKKKVDDKKKKDGDAEEKKDEVKPLKVDWEGLDERKAKLTIFSSFLSDYILDAKGENLYFLALTDEGYSLWQTKLKEKETKVLTKLGKGGSPLIFDKDEKNIFASSDGNLTKITSADGKQEPVAFNAEMSLNADAERAYMFEHVWRQFKKKFYLEDLHGVDWNMYKENYKRFLPYIDNPYDFADMLGEMLGEVNASHTGAFYGSWDPANDQTAAFGAYFDETYTGVGLRIAGIMPRSPLANKDALVKTGTIIEKVNGVAIEAGVNYYALLNRKTGKKTLISYYDPTTKKRWDEVVEPISLGSQNQLAYERWVKTREAETEKLSAGKLGYVHVRGMNSESFRELYSKALGKYNDKEALIVDTRFNGGGWLHDDLATFLSGESYMQFEPRGQKNMGGEPLGKWQKPSAVIICEGNYSDAHLFPYTYKYFNIGKLIGMPVPGTGTAVWWEQLPDGTVFGIPQLGMRDVRTGLLMENNQLEPDIKVANQPAMVSRGRDEQLEQTVKHLLEVVKK